MEAKKNIRGDRQMINVAECVENVQEDDELINVLWSMSTFHDKSSSEEEPEQFDQSALHDIIQQRNSFHGIQSDKEILFVGWESSDRSDNKGLFLECKGSDQQISKEYCDCGEGVNGVQRSQWQGIFLQTVETKLNNCGNVNDDSGTINNVPKTVGSGKREENKSVTRTANANISSHPEQRVLFAKNTTPTSVANCAETISKILKVFKICNEKHHFKTSKKIKPAKLTRK